MESQDDRSTESKQGLGETDRWMDPRADCGARNSAAAHQGAPIVLALKPPPQPSTSLEPGKVSDGPYKEKWDPLTRPRKTDYRETPPAQGHGAQGPEGANSCLHALGETRPRANAWPTAPDCPLTRPGCVSAPLICRPPGPQGQGGRTARGRAPVLTFLGSHRKLSTTKSHPSSLPERGRAWAEGT